MCVRIPRSYGAETAALAARANPSDLGAVAELASAQRADLASTASLNATLSAAAMAYVLATIYYRDQIVATLGDAASLVPAPVWVAGSFAALASVSMRHRLAVLRKLEVSILRESRTESGALVASLWTAADDVMEHKHSDALTRLILAFTVAPIGLLVVAYGYLFWVDTFQHPVWQSVTIVTAFCVWTLSLSTYVARNWHEPTRPRT